MKKILINSKTINTEFDFDDLEDCRYFLNNLHIGDKKVEGFNLSNGEFIRMEDVPEDQIIQRARELRGWIFGGPKEVK